MLSHRRLRAFLLNDHQMRLRTHLIYLIYPRTHVSILVFAFCRWTVSSGFGRSSIILSTHKHSRSQDSAEGGHSFRTRGGTWIPCTQTRPKKFKIFPASRREKRIEKRREEKRREEKIAVCLFTVNHVARKHLEKRGSRDD